MKMGAGTQAVPAPSFPKGVAMRDDRKVAFGAGLILFAMMVSVELIGWKRVTVIWLLLFAGSLVIKLVRVVF